MKYRKKPLIVDAMCFTGGNFVAIRKWQESFGDEHRFWSVAIDSPLVSQGMYGQIWSNSSWVGVRPSEWIIRDEDGEYSKCSQKKFEKSYEAAPVEKHVDYPQELIHREMMKKYLEWGVLNPPQKLG